jgi:hypothetical protein
MLWIGMVVLLLICQAAPVASAAYHRYRGCIHVHTRYSDGSGEFADVAAAAQKVGLDYVITSDHNTLQPLKDGHERYWGKTLILVGTEISTEAGHCLGLDLPASFTWGTRDPQTVIDRVNAAGGFAILAHPMSPRWLWQDWSVRNYAGIEIANLSSLFDDDLLSATDGGRIGGRSLARLVKLMDLYGEDPDRLMATLTDNVVTRERHQWNALLAKGLQMVGTGAVDAHARLPLGRKVYKIPTYSEAFESVQSYLLTLAPLTGDVKHDREQVYGAVRNGRLYLVYPRVAPAPRFQFLAREGERQATMGQPIRLENRVSLTVSAPGHPHPVIRLLREGKEIAHAEGERLVATASAPGNYRVEVYAAKQNERLLSPRNGQRTVQDLLRARPRQVKPWIFSNPIYIRH